MSSRFIASGGAEIETPAENDDWARARKQVEERKKPQVDAVGIQEGGKSLYEHLQAQKAAKQEAFEEASKLRNQFRPLDDSEVDFLESIKQKELAEALDARKATAEQLDVFRREQASMESTSTDESLGKSKSAQADNSQDSWITTKKRRRPQTEEALDASKPKKASTGIEKEQWVANQRETDVVENEQKTASSIQTKSTTHKLESSLASTIAPDTDAKPIPTSILVVYDSDSDA